MKAKLGKRGVTLTEMTVVVAVVALLAAFGLPAVRAFLHSFESSGNTRAMISAAMASARAIAAKEQRYAGIRFQKAYNPDDPLSASQYMVFIVHDVEGTGLAVGFRAVAGLEPIKLPDSVGVMDLLVRTTHADPEVTDDELIMPIYLDDANPLNRDPDGENKYVTDMCSFSIVFSPAGKMVTHEVRVRNRDGYLRPVNLNDSDDDIFNSPVNIVSNNRGMFVQDDYAERGLGAELSRNSFVIYDTAYFDKLDSVARFDYLINSLKPIYVNRYTGTIISAD